MCLLSILTWLHLSDWHQKGSDFDRQVVRDALIKDIANRARIHPDLSTVDFIVFSGDLTFSGSDREYVAARRDFLDPVLAATSLDPDKVFCVPGNHDFDREAFELLPWALQQCFTDEGMVQKWLQEQKKRNKVLEPFENYRSFITGFSAQPDPDYASVNVITVRGVSVALLCLNSALMAGRNKTNEIINDYGFSVVGEPQIHDALARIEGAAIKVVVLHHPFDWLAEFDRYRIKNRLRQNCDFILTGHEHCSDIEIVKSTIGNCITIPAGASYNRRVAAHPRFTNSYNFVALDIEQRTGVAYLRRWNDINSVWREDSEIYPPNGTYPLSF
jgi:predicted phosphodiesterase